MIKRYFCLCLGLLLAVLLCACVSQSENGFGTASLAHTENTGTEPGDKGTITESLPNGTDRPEPPSSTGGGTESGTQTDLPDSGAGGSLQEPSDFPNETEPGGTKRY